MEKYAVLGEILYIGFVFEKTRCKSTGLWKRSYKKNLNKHIVLLKMIAKCIQAPFDIEKDNALLKEICQEIQNDNKLKNYYPFEESFIKKTQGGVITDCKPERKNSIIINFVIRLLDDLSLELEKGFHKDKEKICRIIFSLHNLPRVYLCKGENTLCMLGMLGHEGISIKCALEYSKSRMDDEMITKYQQFLAYRYEKNS